MRIIAGTARGIKLENIKTADFRPTLDRVKENFFNAIHFDLPESRVLDLFCGSGQLGLEALSRGAGECVFVDIDVKNIEIARLNAKKTNLEDKCKFFVYNFTDYLNIIKKQQTLKKFDIIFLDPPYDAEFLNDALYRLEKFDLINDGAIIICESDKQLNISGDTFNGDTFNRREFKYGSVFITILNRA